MSATPSNTIVSAVKEGQTVKFIPRDDASEARVVPYYDFYTGLTGTVVKTYDDGTAAVMVDRAALPDDARERHEKSERDMRDKWMRSLSEDDRSKLTEVQKQFRLRYTLLASATDLIDIKAQTPPVAAKEMPIASSALAPAPRPTEEEIAANEAAHLEEIKRRSLQE